MRLGFGLPQCGAAASPEAIVTVVRRAEAAGFDSLWVFGRILSPVVPRAPFPLPVKVRNTLDPLETLTFAGAHTQRVALGTSVLNLPWYNPVLLARRLASLDVLSGGRLRVGLGIGWSPEEYEASGTPWERSFIGLKPVQKPHPPIYMAAYASAAIRRVARVADGWMPVAMPLAGLAQTYAHLRDQALRAGRDTLALIVRANVEISEEPRGPDRASFTGTLAHAGDVRATRAIGAAELLFDVQFSPGVETAAYMVTRMEQLRDIASRA